MTSCFLFCFYNFFSKTHVQNSAWVLYSNMDPKQLQLLAGRYMDGTITESEARLLHEWYDSLREEDTTLANAGPFSDTPELKAVMLQNIEAAIQATRQDTPVLSVNRRSARIQRRRWISAAAILLLMVGGGYWLQRTFTGNTANQQAIQQDIPPGHSGAILTLSNGKRIELDSTGNGTVAQDGNIEIIQLNGAIQYSGEGTSETAWNTLSTPVGRQYQIVLPDGSKVYLNAASSLKYPTTFNREQRRVELSGEGYFEIAGQPGKPFVVAVKNTEVQVLGTSFNINAYENEAVLKTTLINGKVRIVHGTQSQELLPGEQTLLAANGFMQKISQADIQQAIAWKEGIFQFNHADLKTVLRELTRWYNVEIKYEGAVPPLDFGGAIGRDLHLSQVLKILQQSQVSCRIEGQTLIIESP